MRQKISSLSVSQKTLLLLILFIMLPLLVVGLFATSWINKRDMQSKLDITIQRLHSISENISAQMTSIERVADTLTADSDINDIAQNQNASVRHYAANQTMKAALEYNEPIVKIQILSDDGKVTWQYHNTRTYVFPEYGNEAYAELINRQEKSSFWSSAHSLLQLDKGEFSKEIQVTSFYKGIYDYKSMRQEGVLALHILEESLCNIYQNFLQGEPEAAWLISKDGSLLSSTEKPWLTAGIPEELQLKEDIAKSGVEETFYNGSNMLLLWQQCGDKDCYLVQLIRQTGILRGFRIFALSAIAFFIIIYIGYMYYYRIYVIHPLASLTQQMERAKNLELKQEQLPAKGDEIGLLTTTFQGMLSRIDELIAKVYVEKIKTQEAEREVMLSQINPHFLYNTLDSIRWNALSHGDKEVGKQLEALSLMLRNSLNFGEMDTTIKHEIQTIESYCYLLQARFRKEIEVTIQVDSRISGCRIPKLLIQPLVENAYKHGLENKIGLKKIWIRVRKEDNHIAVCVADNGVGCDKNHILDQMKTDDGSICFALKNIRDRINLSYGCAGTFDFSSRPGRGTIVKIRLPLNMDIANTDY